jgi:hypothetical protein
LLIAVSGVLLFFVLWQLGEMGFLFLLPSQRTVSRMYARMERASVGLLPDLPRGHTPDQFRSALTHKFKGVVSRAFEPIFSPAVREIEHLTALYATQVFSEHSPGRPQVRDGIRAWTRLRWRLWFADRWLRGKG